MPKEQWSMIQKKLTAQMKCLFHSSYRCIMGNKGQHRACLNHWISDIIPLVNLYLKYDCQHKEPA